MLFLRFLLIAIGVGLFGSASGVIAYDIYLAAQLRRLLGRNSPKGRSEAAERPLRPLSLVQWTPAQRPPVQPVAPFPLRLSNVRILRAAARARARAN